MIVLHVHDEEKSNIASEYELDLLIELGLDKAPNHRHCFVGGIEEYTDWSSKLPNCYFSLSSRLISDPQILACLKSVGRPDRLHLETPSLDRNPYLSYMNGENS